ncbi:hypothetical protein [Kribbella sp. NPDC003557]
MGLLLAGYVRAVAASLASAGGPIIAMTVARALPEASCGLLA